MLKIVGANLRYDFSKTNSLPKKMKKYLPYFFILLVGFVIGILCRPNHIREVVSTQIDTLVVRDTLIEEKPIMVEKAVKDSVLVAVHDTTRIKDSVFVAIPIEKKTYKGEDYLAEISGYKASLERIEVYPKNVVISKTETTTQSVTKCNTLSLGFEIQYNGTTSIPIYLEYSHLLHKNASFYARAYYDVPTMIYGFGLGAKVSIGW